MEYRNLGQTDLRTSVIGFGCNLIGKTRTLRDHREAETTLRQALDRGINLYDTADVYSQGDSERMLGSVFRGRRDEVIICSKAGCSAGLFRRPDQWVVPAAKRFLRRWKPVHDIVKAVRSTQRGKNFAPRYLRTAIEGSLRRLRTEYLDMFLLHSPPIELVTDGAVLELLESLKAKGLIRHYGVSISNHGSTDDAIAWIGVSGISVVQVLSNPLRSIDIEKIIAMAPEKGAGVIARQPFHSGQIFSDRHVQEIAWKDRRRTVAQIALQFAMQSKGVSSVLVGMRSRKHLNDNVGSLSCPPLTPDEITALRDLTTIQ